MGWVWWMVTAVLLLLAEHATATLACLMAAIGAAVAAGLAALGLPLAGQVPVFVLVSLGLIVLARPAVVRRQALPGLRTGVAALVGSNALVTRRVDAHSGHIDLGGQTWSARSYDPDAVFEPGAVVHVLEISGATALVG
ncbi:NfeD family protein [Actinocrinis puniceicyclus]|uniref:NfeD family protein n=1 Tax=Actinocrinis puniceicyclus TaxID=977794 RepID=A0A8J7WS79_9ACTN|nr:NfeD family protein [Actinocrinis puniceicyclus]MBS2965765.1 NfeD family protein [Actinocrinis puniceicyclus]